jgi:hypothetical protein
VTFDCATGYNNGYRVLIHIAAAWNREGDYEDCSAEEVPRASVKEQQDVKNTSTMMPYRLSSY